MSVAAITTCSHLRNSKLARDEYVGMRRHNLQQAKDLHKLKMKWPHIYNSVAPVHERDLLPLADDSGILLLKPHNLQWDTGAQADKQAFTCKTCIMLNSGMRRLIDQQHSLIEARMVIQQAQDH